MPSREQLAELRDAILAAFDGTTCPPEPEIAPHECEECAAVRATFARVDWRALPPASIEEHCSVLPLFSPEAYPYFLGAWLLYAVDHFATHSLPFEFLVYDLAPDALDSGDEDRIEWKRRRLRYVTHDQLKGAARFLDAVEAEADLEQYFGDLAPGRAFYRECWEQRWSS